MANTNGSQSLTKSMNGLIEIEDGGGTIIEDGIVTCNEVITNNIQGQSEADTITLYTDTTTGLVTLKNIILGTNTITSTTPLTSFSLFANQLTTANVYIGSSLTRVFASSFVFRDNLMAVSSTNTLVNLFTTQTGTGSVTIGTSLIKVRTGGFVFENNTLNHLAPEVALSLFTTHNSAITIGGVTTSIQLSRFIFYGNSGINANSIQFATGFTDTPIRLFTTQTDFGSITIGSRTVLLNFGGFSSNYSQLRALIPSSPVTLFDNHTDSITLGNIASTLALNASTATINATKLNISNNGNSFEFSAGGNETLLGFHSNNLFTTDFDARISCIGGSVTDGGGTLNLRAQAINLIGSAYVLIEAPFLAVGSGGGLLEFTTGVDKATIDFHSNNAFYNDYDARISSSGGNNSVLNGGATLDITSKIVNINTPNLNIKNAGNFLELTVDINASRIDFHSNPLFTTDYDARISGAGGTASTGGGSLLLLASTIYLNASSTVEINVPSAGVNVYSTSFTVNNGVYGTEISSGGGNSLIDFHSCPTYNDYDARIMSIGGTTGVAGMGTLAITANRTAISGITTIASGINLATAVVNIATINTTLRDGIAIRAVGQNSLWYLAFINQANTAIGQIVGNGTGVTYLSASDKRLKKEVVPMENILDKVMMLNPCEYNWISDESHSFGFIAQEVFKVFPEMRSDMPNSDGNLEEPCDKDTGEPVYYGLDYGKLTPFLVKSVQELNEKVIMLEKNIEMMTSSMNEMMSKIMPVERTPSSCRFNK